MSTRLTMLVEQFKKRQEAAYLNAYEAAQILHQIHEDKLYLETHRSFGAFCLEVFEISLTTGKRMLAQVAETQSEEERPGQHGPPRPISQRAALRARKERAIEAKASEDPDQQDLGLTSDKPATVAQPTRDAELAKANKKAEMYQSALDAHKKQSDAKIAELTLEIDRILQGPPAPAQAPEPDFMTQLAIALELSVDSTPEQLLVKVKNLMHPTLRKPAPRPRSREVVTMFKKGAK